VPGADRQFSLPVEVLVQLNRSRYQGASVIVTSQQSSAAGVKSSVGLLGRLLHHSIVVVPDGDERGFGYLRRQPGVAEMLGAIVGSELLPRGTTEEPPEQERL
jgi:hypothetical protein